MNISVEQQKRYAAVWQIAGSGKPSVRETVRVAEAVRRAAMQSSKFLLGENSIPFLFSGHDGSESLRHEHRHAMYLPWDCDGDGLVDHVALVSPQPFSEEERLVIARMFRVSLSRECSFALLISHFGDAHGLTANFPALGLSSVWRSCTPYLHPWFAKRQFGVVEQVQKELRLRSIESAMSVVTLPGIRVGGQGLRCHDFIRTRSRKDMTQPDRMGSFVGIVFSKPVYGPIALGFGNHFGLGQFAPCAGDDAAAILLQGMTRLSSCVQSGVQPQPR
jgi:CRISPR-associated protein Csb2